MDIIEQVAEIKAKKAREEGIVEARQVMVAKLLRETSFSNEKISSLADVSVDVVKEMKKGIRK